MYLWLVVPVRTRWLLWLNVQVGFGGERRLGRGSLFVEARLKWELWKDLRLRRLIGKNVSKQRRSPKRMDMLELVVFSDRSENEKDLVLVIAALPVKQGTSLVDRWDVVSLWFLFENKVKVFLTVFDNSLYLKTSNRQSPVRSSKFQSSKKSG